MSAKGLFEGRTGMSANQTFTVLLFCPASNIHPSALEKEKQVYLYNCQDCICLILKVVFVWFWNLYLYEYHNHQIIKYSQICTENHNILCINLVIIFVCICVIIFIIYLLLFWQASNIHSSALEIAINFVWKYNNCVCTNMTIIVV